MGSTWMLGEGGDRYLRGLEGAESCMGDYGEKSGFCASRMEKQRGGSFLKCVCKGDAYNLGTRYKQSRYKIPAPE